MTNRTNPNSRNSGFSAEAYRQAMGPGYLVAVFKEQPEVTANLPGECACGYFEA